MPYGLQLVRYGGGGDFRFVDSELHICLGSAARGALAAAEAADMHASNSDIDASCSFPVKLIALAMRALEHAAPGMADIGRGDFWPDLSVLRSAAYWAAASWELHVACASAVPGGARANLYFHGWLHEASRLQGEGSGILQPLVGVFEARGSIRYDKGDGDMLAAGGAQHARVLRRLKFHSL